MISPAAVRPVRILNLLGLPTALPPSVKATVIGLPAPSGSEPELKFDYVLLQGGVRALRLRRGDTRLGDVPMSSLEGRAGDSARLQGIRALAIRLEIRGQLDGRPSPYDVR